MAGLDRQVQPLEDQPVGVIGEFHPVEDDLAPGYLDRLRVRLVGDLGLDVEQVEHLAHVHQALPDLAVDRAEEVQRHGDLDHVGVDHHELAHGEGAGGDLERAQHHDRHQPDGDDEGLAEIQPRQRQRGRDRGLLVALHRLVIALGLAPLGAEILHRLEVQQAVDRLLVGVGVLLVHLLADLHAPFGHLEGEPDIERDGDHHGQQVAGPEGEGEDAADHRQFQRQRAHREQQEAQQELDALDAALDDPAQPAGLAGDVVAQAERVDVLEGLERQHPERPLADPREHRVAQLVEADAGHPHHAIGHHQPDRGADQQVGGALRALFGRHAVDGGAEQRRDRNRRDLADDQRHQRQHDAYLDVGTPLGPQIRPHLANGAQTALPLGCRRECLAAHVVPVRLPSVVPRPRTAVGHRRFGASRAQMNPTDRRAATGCQVSAGSRPRPAG